MERLVYRLDERQAEAFFTYAGFRARNLSEPLRRAGRRLLHHVNLTFATEGAWIGEEWPELDPTYAAHKLADVGAKPMLVYSGELRRDAISDRTLRIEQHGEGATLVYSLANRKAAAHQYGGWVDEKGREHPPARPFFEVTPELVEGIETDFRIWLEEIKGVNARRRHLDLPMPI